MLAFLRSFRSAPAVIPVTPQMRWWAHRASHVTQRQEGDQIVVTDDATGYTIAVDARDLGALAVAYQHVRAAFEQAH